MVESRIKSLCRKLDYYAGDIIWINYDPHSGTEEGGHDSESNNIARPMLVLSNHFYNIHRLVIGMTITSHISKKNVKYTIPLKTTRHVIHGFILPANLSGFDKISRHASNPIDALDPVLWSKVDLFVHSIFQR